jgi:plastocyanin
MPARRTCLLSALIVSNLAAGDLTGQIRLADKYRRRPAVIPVYDLRGAQAAKSDSAVDEMQRVAVFLSRENLPAEPPISFVINQRDRRFEPELLIVPAGSTVQFPNFDPVFHNVFSLSKARPFDLGVYPRGASRSVRFDRPGVVQVYCHLHPNMHAAIVVAANSWHTRPSSDGKFSLEGVPEGQYTLAVWHNTAGLFERTIAVPAAGAIAEDFTIPLPRP